MYHYLCLTFFFWQTRIERERASYESYQTLKILASQAVKQKHVTWATLSFVNFMKYTMFWLWGCENSFFISHVQNWCVLLGYFTNSGCNSQEINHFLQILRRLEAHDELLNL